jgi:hypothetical protein
MNAGGTGWGLAAFRYDPNSGATRTGLSKPSGVAVDSGGNVYFSFFIPNWTIQEWIASGGQVVTLFNTQQFNNKPNSGITFDALGDAYVANGFNVIEWNLTNGSNLIPRWSNGTLGPTGVGQLRFGLHHPQGIVRALG